MNLWHWETFVPNIGDNRQLLSGQLTLELAVGLTKVQLAAAKRAVVETLAGPEREALRARFSEWQKAIETELTAQEIKDWNVKLDAAMATQEAAYASRLAAAWNDVVRVPLTNKVDVDGKPIATLADYLTLVCSQAGRFNFIELQNELWRLNSVDGSRALFSEPQSGGSTSTPRQPTAPAGSQTGGR